MSQEQNYMARIADALELIGQRINNVLDVSIAVQKLAPKLDDVAGNLTYLETTNEWLAAISAAVKSQSDLLQKSYEEGQKTEAEGMPVYNLERNVKLSIDAKLFKESRIPNTEVGEAAVVIDDGFTRRTAIFDICTNQIEGSTLLRLSIEGEL